jgi:hypothetical protein
LATDCGASKADLGAKIKFTGYEEELPKQFVANALRE